METFTARDAMQKASEPRVMGLDVVLDFCSAVMCKFILAIYLCTSFLYFTKKTFDQILFSSDCHQVSANRGLVLGKSSIYVHFRLLRFGLSSLKSVTSS